MKLSEGLAEKKAAILKRWFALICDGYPEPFGRFLQEEPDPFSNPVGHAFRRAMEEVWGMALEGKEGKGGLAEAMRLRAVQDFAPSKAVAFVLLLKEATREVMGPGGLSPEQWLAFDKAVDEVALRAFDLYMEAREAVHRLRRRELEAQREMAFKALARAGGA